VKKGKDINFKNLTYEGFKKLAKDVSLSKYEKIGFPNSYRKNKEKVIFNDICNKVKNINRKKQMVLDIGCGCSDLPLMIIDKTKRNNSKLFFIDSEEMLSQLPSPKHLTKIATFFPECEDFINEYAEKFDVIIVYSVFHYIFNESNVYKFIDSTLKLLNYGGELLIGDIPNQSMRKRFFSSPTGIEFHKKFMKTDKPPIIKFNIVEEKEIDDSVIFSIIMRCRNQGFHAYILPQDKDLPMSNRREDILIIRP